MKLEGPPPAEASWEERSCFSCTSTDGPGIPEPVFGSRTHSHVGDVHTNGCLMKTDGSSKSLIFMIKKTASECEATSPKVEGLQSHTRENGHVVGRCMVTFSSMWRENCPKLFSCLFPLTAPGLGVGCGWGLNVMPPHVKFINIFHPLSLSRPPEHVQLRVSGRTVSCWG